jgi:hypothetical protein
MIASLARSRTRGQIGTLLLLLLLLAAAGLAPASLTRTAAANTVDDHDVVGRFSITSDAGGAVWAFQPSGLLIVTGPGDIISAGSWTPASGDREFDAVVDYDIAGQTLTIQGQVAPDEHGIAIYVLGTEAQRPGDGEPWPAVSRLIGERVALTPETTALPSPAPIDCVRPDWVDGEVDWDRCDASPLSEA